MFDFFRDIVLENKGIDTKEMHKQRMEKREQMKLSRFIFSKKTKVTICIIGALFLLFASLQIANLWSVDYVAVLINFILSLIAIAVCICLMTGRKKCEIVALTGSVLFIIVAYGSVIIR